MADAAIEQTFEFDESELYNNDGVAEQLAADMSEEEPTQHACQGSESDSDFQPEFDKHSGNDDVDSESTRSVSLQVSLPDIDSQELSPTEHYSKAALGTTFTKAIYNPRPVPATRLGTSAPINIPHMSRWKLGSATEGGAAPAEMGAAAMPQTFIPPHQLSQKDDFMFSFTGASPSAVLKRDRLRQRNVILRSTGFLENSASENAAAAAARAAAAAAASQQEPQRITQSSLTAALTTIGEC